MSMKVRMADTGRVVIIENDEYAIRLLEQRKAFPADSEDPVTPEGEPVDFIQVSKDCKALLKLGKVLARAWMDTDARKRDILAAGAGSKVFDVGDEIGMPWTAGSGTEYRWVWRVVHKGAMTDEYGVIHPEALILCSMYTPPTGVSFDAPEMVLATEDVFLDGVHYFTRSASTGNFYHVNVTYGNPIPAGSQYYVNWHEDMAMAMVSGYNRWRDGNGRQWLNSEAAAGDEWHTEQHRGDAGPAAAILAWPGFLAGFPEEYRSLFKTVRIETPTNTLTDGGEVDVTYDRIFIPTVSNVGGSVTGIEDESGTWDWFKDDDEESDVTEKRIFPRIDNQSGGGESVLLRNPHPDTAHLGAMIQNTGSVTMAVRMDDGLLLPCCAIW